MDPIFNRESIAGRATRKARAWIDSIIEAPDSLAWLMFIVLAANTLAYIVMFSNPLIQSDAWYFLGTFVRKAVDGTLHLGDFFMQRGGMDHAQPLRKLILLGELKFFALDLRYEAIAGWAGAIVSILVLRRLVLWHETPGHRFKGLRVWIWATLCMVLFSMNSPVVWNWPLMAGSFTSFALMFATLLGLWRWLALGRPTCLIICAIAFDIAADDMAMLANVACLMALALVAWQNPSFRKRTLTGAGMLVASLIIVRIVYALMFTPPTGLRMPLGVRLDHLGASFVDGGWWQWFIVPLASSIANIQRIKSLAGSHATAMQIAIGVPMLLAHAWFWWRVLWKRPKITASSFAAIVVMLIFYAILAGIVYGRVPSFGNSYLNQPRYALLYSFNIVALLLMCASLDWESLRVRSIAPPALLAFIVLFACWQISLADLTWKTAPYVKAYQQGMARQIGQLADDPVHVPEHCLPQLVVCRYPVAKRVELVGFLKSHRLNVFSPKFQRINRLSPDHPPQ